MIKKIVWGLIMFFGLFNVAAAQTQQLADISVYNFSAENNLFSFEVVNNGNTVVHDLTYGIVLKDREGLPLKRESFPEKFDMNSGERVNKKVPYIISEQQGVAKYALYIINESGLPLAVSSMQLEGDLDGVKKATGQDILSSCELIRDDQSEKITCGKAVSDNVNISIYKQSFFGEKMFEGKIIWDKENENMNSFTLPAVDPGMNKIRVRDGGFEKTFNLMKEGEYVKISAISLDQDDYTRGEKSVVHVSVATNMNKVHAVYGIMDRNGDSCAFEDGSISNDTTQLNFSVKKDCYSARVFMILKNNDGQVMDQVGTENKTEQDLSNIESNFTLKDLMGHSSLPIAIILLLIGVGVITFMKGMKKSSILLIVVAILMIGFLGYQKILAAAYYDRDNNYTVNFSQENYTVDDDIVFTLGIFNKISFEKEQVRVDLSINDGHLGLTEGPPDEEWEEQPDTIGEFYPIVFVADRSNEYEINMGKMPVGTHKIILITQSRSAFNFSKFGIAKFGSINGRMEFDVVVKEEAEVPVDPVVDPVTPVEPPVDPVDPVVDPVTPVEPPVDPVDPVVQPPIVPVDPPINAECNNDLLNNPTDNICLSGDYDHTSIQLDEATLIFTWMCRGAHGGSDESCSLQLPEYVGPPPIVPPSFPPLTPRCVANYGHWCASATNVCGDRNSGQITCIGHCTAGHPPADPAWVGPDPSEVCSDAVSTQERCGMIKNQVGTKNCTVCSETDWSGPLASSVCSNVEFIQTKCDESRVVLGTKACPAPTKKLNLECSVDRLNWNDCSSVIKLAHKKVPFFIRNYLVLGAGQKTFCSTGIDLHGRVSINTPDLQFTKINNEFSQVDIIGSNIFPQIFTKKVFGACNDSVASKDLTIKIIDLNVTEI